MSTTTLESGPCQKPFDEYVELFLHHLRAAGYAERTLRKKRWALRSLARWAQRKGIAVADFRDRHAAAFLARSYGRAKDFVAVQRRAIRQFQRFLRSGTGDAHSPAPRSISVGHGLLGDYEDYLRNNRGLAENSILVYIPFIRSFLKSQKGRTDRVSSGGLTRWRFGISSWVTFKTGPASMSGFWARRFVPFCVFSFCPAGLHGIFLLRFPPFASTAKPFRRLFFPRRK